MRCSMMAGSALFFTGGHRWNSTIPGKKRFPSYWEDDKIIETVQEVALRPDGEATRLASGGWECRGTRDNVEVVVVLEPDGGIRAAWPEQGPGVTRNPR
jgi:hypothetical protein